jgi:diaminohydroxyphosphoribosylaminopyrimidine deaminase/5-amino-6-(5-phosphoribosylamino)uracil reductase
MATPSPSISAEFHRAMMQRCLQLAQRGLTAPNPLVGSVIVKQGQIVGEGFHPQAGQPHAEVFALRAAGDAARGATLYVNLEPCNHTGRTPPCTEAILQAGIETVVIGMPDPNPVATGGIERLRAAGLTVISGIETTACRQLNEAFIHRLQYRRPFGILKYAMTLDGKIAAASGHSTWITSPAARRRVHQLRAGCDAIIVGGNTVRQDNPRLTSHGVNLGTDRPDHNPLRVVMSRKLDLPEHAHLWDTTLAPTLVFSEQTEETSLKIHLKQQGVELITIAPLEPDRVMQILYERGLTTVLWECGGALAAAALQQQAIQKVWAFIAPKFIGGNKAPGPIGDLGLTSMGEALPLSSTTLEYIEPDWLIQAYLESQP